MLFLFFNGVDSKSRVRIELVGMGEMFGERIKTATFGVDKRSVKRILGGRCLANLIGSGTGKTLTIGGVQYLSWSGRMNEIELENLTDFPDFTYFSTFYSFLVV